MTPEQRREVARLGGIAAQAEGRAHKWSVESARAASAKGIAARRAKKLAAAGKAA